MAVGYFIHLNGFHSFLNFRFLNKVEINKLKNLNGLSNLLRSSSTSFVHNPK
ncbi:hypothetical protein MYP_3906 [Sporocytophaga myxococcoides]|uniref:Uncharacterized protein n=1 Tax=Sporocytophaga myxococcoides TaxID=153721 RepID=A0A098LI49_9BACT|nr:hypothetical protein MYP_3906 [Sporocytophaga myxococcoides]